MKITFTLEREFLFSAYSVSNLLTSLPFPSPRLRIFQASYHLPPYYLVEKPLETHQTTWQNWVSRNSRYLKNSGMSVIPGSRARTQKSNTAYWKII